RLEHRGVLMALDALHQLAAAAWIAGLVHLAATAFSRRDEPRPVALLRRFSSLAMVAATALVIGGGGLTLVSVHGVAAAPATPSEVATRFTPRWPALKSPPIDQLPVDDPAAPRTDADRAWSEYNHHVSGLFVLLMGTLAVLHATGLARWARHWPLVFLGLAA